MSSVHACAAGSIREAANRKWLRENRREGRANNVSVVLRLTGDFSSLTDEAAANESEFSALQHALLQSPLSHAEVGHSRA